MAFKGQPKSGKPLFPRHDPLKQILSSPRIILKL